MDRLGDKQPISFKPDRLLGGNKVVSVSTKNLQLVSPPDGGETLRATRYGATLVQSGEQDYDEARTQWASASDKPAREVLWQIGGEPSWLQNEETPTCKMGEALASARPSSRHSKLFRDTVSDVTLINLEKYAHPVPKLTKNGRLQSESCRNTRAFLNGDSSH